MASQIERLHLKYTTLQLFDLVADIERYPEFLPWVTAVSISRREGQTIWADMTIGTKFLCKRVTTVAVLDRPHRIDISGRDRLFDRFEQRWNFRTGSAGGTNVEYQVDFKFRSGFLQLLIGASFAGRANVMMAAFARRARRLYGTPLSSIAAR